MKLTNTKQSICSFCVFHPSTDLTTIIFIVIIMHGNAFLYPDITPDADHLNEYGECGAMARYNCTKIPFILL